MKTSRPTGPPAQGLQTSCETAAWRLRRCLYLTASDAINLDEQGESGDTVRETLNEDENGESGDVESDQAGAELAKDSGEFTSFSFSSVFCAHP